MDILNNEIKREIFELFLKNNKLKFNEIEKHTKIRSNLLTFYIKNLIKEKVIEKSGEHYKLTLEAEKIIPFYKQTFEGNSKLPVVLIAIKKKDELLLLKREERPYKEYFSLLGKKMKLAETIEETAVRCAKEETGLDVKFKKLCGVVHERLKEDNQFKHSFIFFVCIVEPTSKEITKTRELKWFNTKKLDPKTKELSKKESDKIIPSDIWMIKNILPKKQKISEIVMEEKEGELFF